MATDPILNTDRRCFNTFIPNCINQISRNCTIIYFSLLKVPRSRDPIRNIISTSKTKPC